MRPFQILLGLLGLLDFAHQTQATVLGQSSLYSILLVASTFFQPAAPPSDMVTIIITVIEEVTHRCPPVTKILTAHNLLGSTSTPTVATTQSVYPHGPTIFLANVIVLPSYSHEQPALSSGVAESTSLPLAGCFGPVYSTLEKPRCHKAPSLYTSDLPLNIMMVNMRRTTSEIIDSARAAVDSIKTDIHKMVDKTSDTARAMGVSFLQRSLHAAFTILSLFYILTEPERLLASYLLHEIAILPKQYPSSAARLLRELRSALLPILVHIVYSSELSSVRKRFSLCVVRESTSRAIGNVTSAIIAAPQHPWTRKFFVHIVFFAILAWSTYCTAIGGVVKAAIVLRYHVSYRAIWTNVQKRFRHLNDVYESFSDIWHEDIWYEMRDYHEVPRKQTTTHPIRKGPSKFEVNARRYEAPRAPFFPQKLPQHCQCREILGDDWPFMPRPRDHDCDRPMPWTAPPPQLPPRIMGYDETGIPIFEHRHSFYNSAMVGIKRIHRSGKNPSSLKGVSLEVPPTTNTKLIRAQLSLSPSLPPATTTVAGGSSVSFAATPPSVNARHPQTSIPALAMVEYDPNNPGLLPIHDAVFSPQIRPAGPEPSPSPQNVSVEATLSREVQLPARSIHSSFAIDPSDHPDFAGKLPADTQSCHNLIENAPTGTNDAVPTFSYLNPGVSFDSALQPMDSEATGSAADVMAPDPHLQSAQVTNFGLSFTGPSQPLSDPIWYDEGPMDTDIAHGDDGEPMEIEQEHPNVLDAILHPYPFLHSAMGVTGLPVLTSETLRVDHSEPSQDSSEADMTEPPDLRAASSAPLPAPLNAGVATHAPVQQPGKSFTGELDVPGTQQPSISSYTKPKSKPKPKQDPPSTRAKTAAATTRATRIKLRMPSTSLKALPPSDHATAPLLNHTAIGLMGLNSDKISDTFPPSNEIDNVAPNDSTAPSHKSPETSSTVHVVVIRGLKATLEDKVIAAWVRKRLHFVPISIKLVHTEAGDHHEFTFNNKFFANKLVSIANKQSSGPGLEQLTACLKDHEYSLGQAPQGDNMPTPATNDDCTKAPDKTSIPGLGYPERDNEPIFKTDSSAHYYRVAVIEYSSGDDADDALAWTEAIMNPRKQAATCDFEDKVDGRTAVFGFQNFEDADYFRWKVDLDAKKGPVPLTRAFLRDARPDPVKPTAVPSTALSKSVPTPTRDVKEWFVEVSNVCDIDEAKQIDAIMHRIQGWVNRDGVLFVGERDAQNGSITMKLEYDLENDAIDIMGRLEGFEFDGYTWGAEVKRQRPMKLGKSRAKKPKCQDGKDCFETWEVNQKGRYSTTS